MSYEQQTGETNEYDLHSHELHDLNTEHTHDGHACNATCEHHQAVQHIDFMEPIERHNHSHEHGEEHVHRPGCGHVGYEVANLQVDHGKEKSHFHDPHEEHVHGPNCGHMEYQHAHTEIDKPHIHDEHCGHLDHHEAAKHVDRGKEHAHDMLADHQEVEHVHGPNCGHVEYDEASKHVDRHADRQPTVERTVDHTAGDTPPSNGLQVKVAAGKGEEEAVTLRQKAEANHVLKPETIPAQEASSKPDTSAEASAQDSTATESEAPDVSHIRSAVVVQSHKRPVTGVDDMQSEDEGNSLAEQGTKQVDIAEQEQAIKIFEADVITPAPDYETEVMNTESDDAVQMEIPITFTDEEPGLEFASKSPFIDESFEASDETLTDLVSAEMSDTPDLIYETYTLPTDFTQSELLNTGIGLEAFGETPSSQLVEDLTTEDPSVVPMSEGSAQEVSTVADAILAEQPLNFSDFGNGRLPEMLNVEWPALTEVGTEEPEHRLEATRAYIAGYIEHASEIDPANLEAMPDQLIAMLRNMPQECIEELLPQLEELTELYELPGLEKLLELYIAGHYQEQNLLTRLFVSAAQDTQGITARIGQIALGLLKIPAQVQNISYERA